mgnify:CR=1 FL=1
MKKVLMLLLLTLSLSGCGALLTKGPPVGWEGWDDYDPSELKAVALMAPCSNGKALIYADGIMAALYGISFAVGVSGDGNYFSEPVIDALLSSSFALSSWTGNQKINDCAAFNAHVYQRLRKP